MLVNRKQEWMQFPQQERVQKTVTVASPRPNNSFKRKCLQLIFLIAAAAMLVTMQSESIVRAGYGLVELKAEAAKLEKENELLRLDIARLKSPERIQHIATRQLGMVMPQNTYYAAKQPASSPAEKGKAGAQTAGNISILSKAEASKAR
jgi:cell division protein FtsL